MNDNLLTSYSREWFLTAGETNARGIMPVTLIAARAIELATLHANALGIGYSNLSEHSMGWVLARLAIEIYRYPGINETYSMTTWIESLNRHFSDRCFEMTDTGGNTLASIRSMWVAIDTQSRSMADLGNLPIGSIPIDTTRKCPLGRCRQPAIAPGTTVETTRYSFKYTDIDFNRHVNTLRYLEAVLNLRPLEFYDSHIITRLEASFDRECHFGDTVELVTGPSRRIPEAYTTEIISPAGTCAAVDLLFS
ncbi:MAG: thioesterase [Odoribacter sp.]|nr:thioesterase [Odoribacter sp.]